MLQIREKCIVSNPLFNIKDLVTEIHSFYLIVKIQLTVDENQSETLIQFSTWHLIGARQR